MRRQSISNRRRQVDKKGLAAVGVLLGCLVVGVGLSDAQPKPMGPPNTTIPRAEALRALEKERTTGTLPPEAVREMESWRGPDGRLHPPPLPITGPDGEPVLNPDGTLYLYDPKDPNDPRNKLPTPVYPPGHPAGPEAHDPNWRNNLPVTNAARPR